MQRSELEELLLMAQHQSNENHVVLLGKINNEVAEQILATSGIDVFEYEISVDIYAIKHILKNHGNAEKEEKRGQIVVQNDDFELIEQIINKPDVVFYDGKNKIGREILQFQKQVGNRYIILKEIRTGKKQLALNSMRIVKYKKS